MVSPLLWPGFSILDSQCTDLSHRIIIAISSHDSRVSRIISNDRNNTNLGDFDARDTPSASVMRVADHRLRRYVSSAGRSFVSSQSRYRRWLGRYGGLDGELGH